MCFHILKISLKCRMILGRPGSGKPAAPESFVPREREQSAEGADGQEAHGLRTTEVRQFFFIFISPKTPTQLSEVSDCECWCQIAGKSK